MASVILVEDEAVVAMAISRALTRQGFEVRHAFARGEDALRALAEAEVDVLVMDVHLAGDIDGIQMALHLRARTDIPIVFFTGDDLRPLRERVGHLKRVAFLEKPSSVATLVSTMRQVLAEP